MGGLFSKSKKPVSRVTEQDKAVLQLKQQRDKLRQYQKKIEQTLERQRQLAKKLLAEDKRDKAKLLLKKKRYLENLLQNTDCQLEKLEQLTHDLEFTQIEVQVWKTYNLESNRIYQNIFVFYFYYVQLYFVFIIGYYVLPGQNFNIIIIYVGIASNI